MGNRNEAIPQLRSKRRKNTEPKPLRPLHFRGILEIVREQEPNIAELVLSSIHPIRGKLADGFQKREHLIMHHVVDVIRDPTAE